MRKIASLQKREELTDSEFIYGNCRPARMP